MGCNGSKTVGRGRGGEHLSPPPPPTARRTLGLSRSLAWIQEKNFEDKFEVVKIIGQGSIGEVSIVKRKSLSNSLHGSYTTSYSKEAVTLDITTTDGGGTGSGGGGGGGGGDGVAHEGERKGEDVGGATWSIPSPPKGAAAGTQDRLYAMKSIHVNRLSKTRVEEFENEVDILQRLHHPNIIQLREVFYYKKKIYMCMTLCTGGQLNHRDFNEAQVCSVMSQVIRALVYMHETAQICHRDLKMENIMLESPQEPLVVKLIDFGLSKVFTAGDKMRTACGTVYTMAPEVLSGAGYTQKADLWSAGVIAFVLLCGSLPFLKDEADLNDKDKVEQLAQARFLFNDPAWRTVSSAGKGFVRGLLKKQPGFRWAAREAMDHCTDLWDTSLSRASYSDLSAQAEAAAQLARTASNGSANRDLSALGSPGGTSSALSPLPSPGSSTHASRNRLRAVPGAIATSMRRFADYGELKKAALMVTAFQLDREGIKQLKDAFLEVDTKGDGAINLEELRMVLREHGVGGAEVDRVFGAVDMDSSGRLHYMEFLAATVEARGFIEEESLKDAFERLDVDCTGFISRDNLKVVLGKTYDNALIDKMLEEGDSSLSGSIEWEDFLVMMRPVVEHEYRKEAEAMLADTPAALREAAEVGRRAVDQTPSFAQSIESNARASREASAAAVAAIFSSRHVSNASER